MKTSSTALFLDRDGVINRRLPGRYVSDPSQFEFLPGVLEAIVTCADLFDPIIVITNQQGIGKGLMTERELAKVHQYFQETVEKAGGRIDGIYHCPHLSTEHCPCRKPAPGMVEQACRDFPKIDPQRSVLAGDSFSDLLLGNRMEMQTIWIQTKVEEFSLIRDARKNRPDFYLSAAFESLTALPDWWLTQI